MGGTIEGDLLLQNGRCVYVNDLPVTRYDGLSKNNSNGKRIRFLVQTSGHAPTLIPDNKIAFISGVLNWHKLPRKYAAKIHVFSSIGITMGTKAGLAKGPTLSYTGKLVEILDDEEEFDVWKLRVQVQRRAGKPAVHIVCDMQNFCPTLRVHFEQRLEEGYRTLLDVKGAFQSAEVDEEDGKTKIITLRPYAVANVTKYGIDQTFQPVMEHLHPSAAAINNAPSVKTYSAPRRRAAKKAKELIIGVKTRAMQRADDILNAPPSSRTRSRTALAAAANAA